MWHNLALVFTPIVFFLGVRVYEAWCGSPSPTGEVDPSRTVNPQVTAISDSADTTSGREVVATKDSTPVDGDGRRGGLIEWMKTNSSGRGAAALVRAAMHTHKVSESTAWRALRSARKGGDQ